MDQSEGQVLSCCRNDLRNIALLAVNAPPRRWAPDIPLDQAIGFGGNAYDCHKLAELSCVIPALQRSAEACNTVPATVVTLTAIVLISLPRGSRRPEHQSRMRVHGRPQRSAHHSQVIPEILTE